MKQSKILILGSIALDSIETIHGSHKDLLGGSATYAAVSCSKFVKPNLIGIIGSDFSQNHYIMTKALDSEGWVKTISDSFEVFQSGFNKVHIGIKPSRINSIGESYNSFESLWIVTKLDNTWGVQFRSSFLSNAAEHHKV